MILFKAPIHHSTDACLFHRDLAQFNAQRLAPALPNAEWRGALQTELMFKISEGHFLEASRTEVVP